jgi:hypothetical protein
MCNLPSDILLVLRHFEPAFGDRIWPQALVLVVGALLTPGQRTVAAILRVMGLHHERQFQNYHRVLSRACWSSRQVSRLLLQVLVQTFVPADAPVIIGMDDTIERRRGRKIAARGIYRDPVRSSTEFFVKTSGLRWVSLQLLVPIPWAGQVWALPFLTVLAPSERYHQEHGKRHKTLTDWGRQALMLVRRWLPDRALMVVADSTYAALDLLAACARRTAPITVITRLRLDARLYDPVPERKPGTNGRPRVKGERQLTLAQRLENPQTVWQDAVVRWYGGVLRSVTYATGTAVWYHTGLPPVPIRWVLLRDPASQFEPQALLSTDPTQEAVPIVEAFVLRWQVEVTFHEARAHLGIETQRQWSDRAIQRTTPALLGLFSLVTLLAHQHLAQRPEPVRQAAWYTKPRPTFVDALALVRRKLWPVEVFTPSPQPIGMIEIPQALLARFVDTLAYAA